MGLLDDAIREHLELKRRRGADPDDVARQENEALGAARRAEFARPEGAEAPADTGQAGAPADAAPFDHGDDAPSEPADRAAPPADRAAEPPVQQAETPRTAAADDLSPPDFVSPQPA